MKICNIKSISHWSCWADIIFLFNIMLVTLKANKFIDINFLITKFFLRSIITKRGHYTWNYNIYSVHYVIPAYFDLISRRNICSDAMRWSVSNIFCFFFSTSFFRALLNYTSSFTHVFFNSKLIAFWFLCTAQCRK